MAESEAMSELSKRLEQIWEKAPDAMKRGVTCFPAALASMTSTVNEYQKTVKPLTQLLTYIRNGESVVPEEANSILDQCATNNPVVTQNRNGLYQALVQPQSASSEQVTKHVEQVVQSTVDKLLSASAIGNFLFVAAETTKLLEVWDVIKEARNLADKWPEKRAEIRTSLQKILGRITVVNKLVSEIHDDSAEVQVIHHAKVMIHVDKIRSMLNDVEKSMRQLEFDVDKKKMSLLGARHRTRMSAVDNTVTGVTTAINVTLFWSNANPWLLGLNALLLVATGISAIANVAACMITRQDLEKIQIELGAFDELELERQDYMNTLESIVDKFGDLAGVDSGKNVPYETSPGKNVPRKRRLREITSPGKNVPRKRRLREITSPGKYVARKRRPRESTSPI